jgi:hypothetical protein
MAQIELTQDEVNMLRDILRKHLSELSFEIAFTHSHRKDFREFLEKRREFIEGFIQRLGRELVSAKIDAISIDRLRKVEFLQDLTAEELKAIAPFFEQEKAASGVTLCEEDMRAERLYVLEEGRVSIRSKKGRQYEIDTPGKVVGWSFLVPPFLYTASAVTIAPSKVLVIKSPDFYYLVHKEPSMGMKVISNLAQVIAGRLKSPGE